MKFLRTVVLASCLMFGCTLTGQQKNYPQDEPTKAGIPAKEYDAGVCGERNFTALHFKIDADKLIVNQVATGPHNAHKTADDVWTLGKKDKDGLHFVQDYEGTHFELILKQDSKNIDGLMYADGKKVARFFGFEQDGKSLNDSGVMLYQMCLQIWEGAAVSSDKS